MKDKWLAAQSFQQTQALISAINTLALGIKYEQAGLTTDEAAKQRARDELSLFLDEMSSVVEKIEHDENQPVIGVSPYLRHLAESFVEPSFSHFYHSPFHSSPSDIKAKLGATTPEEKAELVDELHTLRVILESQAQEDTKSVLGDF
jgi:hypothetical protein